MLSFGETTISGRTSAADKAKDKTFTSPRENIKIVVSRSQIVGLVRPMHFCYAFS